MVVIQFCLKDFSPSFLLHTGSTSLFKFERFITNLNMVYRLAFVMPN